MATSYPFRPIVTDGLIYYVDVANIKSYTYSTYIKDITNNVGDGNLINGATFSYYNSGNILLDGIDDAISLDNDASYFGALGTGTIDIWVKASNSQPNLTPIIFSVTDFNYPTNQQYVYLIYGRGASYIPTDCAFTFISKNSTSSLIFGLQKGTSSFYMDNLWHNVSYQSDVTGNKLYIDGKQETVVYGSGYGSSATHRFLNIAGADRCNIGRRELGVLSNVNLSGNVWYIKIYNRSLSSDEILQNYNAMKNRYLV